MLTPNKYWRVAASLEDLCNDPPHRFLLPSCLTIQKAPPTVGDGVVLAAYDVENRTGQIRHIGVITRVIGLSVEVDWHPTLAEIWVDSSAGIANWKNKAGFGFASSKIAGYGLHQIFAEHFEGLQPRETLPAAIKPRGIAGSSRKTARIPAERLTPMEVVGEATPSPRGGYVYVLKSALGCKIGRTRNIPSRMHFFGIKLPILYTIPLCAWFTDCVDAESRYHQLFASKHINGEWFDLMETDVDLIRRQVFR